jgi:hypothetical protein
LLGLLKSLSLAVTIHPFSSFLVRAALLFSLP